MENAVNFVPSITSTIRRGRKMLAPHKAGIFRFYEKKAIYTCRALAIMAFAHRAERLVVDSGKGKSLFCLPAKNVYNNDLHTTFSHRPRHVLSPGQAYHSFSHAERAARNSQVPKAAHPKVQSRRKGAQAHGFLKLTSHTFSFNNDLLQRCGANL